jgi:hypothetical protein
VLQTGVAIVEGDAAIERLIDLHFGSGEAEAASLLGDLEATALPLHDIVVADRSFVYEAADAVEAVGSRTPDDFHFARFAGKAMVVIGDELAQHGVGGVDVHCFGQPQFTGKAILEHTPETFDAAFGLRTVGGDEGDAELFESTTELGGLAFSSNLFVDRPAVVVADDSSHHILANSRRNLCGR